MGDQPVGGIEFPAQGAAAEVQWYVAVGTEVYGPANKATLAQWAAEGRIIPGAQALRVGDQHWLPFHSMAELAGIPLAPPPAPTSPAYAQPPSGIPQRRLCACPFCEGPVNNVAPVYGWPWGFFQRSLKPEYRCGQCGRQIQFEQLSPTAQAQMSRFVKAGSIGWFIIVIGLILFIALCFFVAFSSFR